MIDDIRQIIKQLDLQPHPEGGYFKETYRSEELIELNQPYHGTRSFSTAIYFLLTAGNFSAFHKIHQDEVWHFYKGSALSLHVISPKGQYECITIGNDLSQNEVPQYVVPGGSWFASETSGAYSLTGCTVAPGFDFQDFAMANRDTLLKICPHHVDPITRLTR